MLIIICYYSILSERKGKERYTVHELALRQSCEDVDNECKEIICLNSNNYCIIILL